MLSIVTVKQSLLKKQHKTRLNCKNLNPSQLNYNKSSSMQMITEGM